MTTARYLPVRLSKFWFPDCQALVEAGASFQGVQGLQEQNSNVPRVSISEKTNDLLSMIRICSYLMFKCSNIPLAGTNAMRKDLFLSPVRMGRSNREWVA